MIDELLAGTGVTPAVNQVEFSPLLFDRDLLGGHLKRSVVVEGYSALRGGTLDHPTIVEIAQRHGKSPAQVIIRWHLQHAIVVIPKSVKRERIIENAAGRRLRAEHRGHGRVGRSRVAVTPGGAPSRRAARPAPSRRTAPAPSRRCRSRRTTSRPSGAAPAGSASVRASGGLPPAAQLRILRRPPVQRRVVVPADVELLVAVQPDVDEVGGDVLDERPLPGGVGDDERDVVRRAAARRTPGREARVPHLERVPQRPVGVGRRAARGPSSRSSCRARQLGRGVGACAAAGRRSRPAGPGRSRGVGGSCQRIGPSFVAERQHAGGEEVGERRRRRRAASSCA